MILRKGNHRRTYLWVHKLCGVMRNTHNTPSQEEELLPIRNYRIRNSIRFYFGG